MKFKLVSKGGLGLILGITLVGCSSTPVKVADCTYPDSPETLAPAWVCDAPIEGVAVSAVGSFRSTNAGVQFQKTQAAAAARNQLASQMKVHVKRLIKNYAETTGVGDDESVDAVSSDVSKQVTHESLFGTKIFRSQVNPDTKTMYVLVGMDTEGAAANAQTAIMTSYKNKRAVWQRFVSDKSHTELDREIEKLAEQAL